ncbi:MAG TPA: barstar family protein [Usitatibacter sp.]|nr:barstar family protein [Usitatibacter sp.]
MPNEALAKVLEERKGGTWFVPEPLDARALQKLAKAEGFAFFHIDGRKINRKEQLMNAAATAMSFPEHFGNNWDALEECLTDLEWVDADGYVLFYDHVDGLLSTHPDQFETLLEILKDAVDAWKADGEPMVVLLSGTKPPKGVAKLKE